MVIERVFLQRDVEAEPSQLDSLSACIFSTNTLQPQSRIVVIDPVYMWLFFSPVPSLL